MSLISTLAPAGQLNGLKFQRTFNTNYARTGDPYFGNVSLLLPMDGSNGSTTFTDNSNNALTVTRSGNVQISTAQSKFGGASALFDGTGDSLIATGNNTVLTFGLGDFTIEFWVYPITLTGVRGLVDFRPSNGAYPLIYSDGSNLHYYVNTANRITGTSALSINQWYHVALVRSGTSTNLFVNGAQVGLTYTDSIDYLAPSLRIGMTFDNFGSNAYIDDLRITKGVARYTPNFTPPSTAFPDTGTGGDTFFATTSLLLHMDGSNGSTTFTDSSSNALTVTRSGDAQISTAQSKFGGASALFDGSGDKLTLSSSSMWQFGTNDFTAECWMYLTGGQSYARLMHFGPYWASDDAWGINAKDQDHPGKLALASYKLGQSRLCVSTTTIATNTWYHVAVTRSNGVFRLFINGTLEATNSSYTTTAIESSSTNTLAIGSATTTSGAEDFAGYIDDLRVTKGVARYTANFTPPTSAFLEAGTGSGDVAFAYNSLLLHMDGTNGSTTFTDNSSNTLTVTPSGNAQISTAQSKFGGASALFDGTGDFLTTASTSGVAFGTGQFTIELWLRLNSLSATYRALVATRPNEGSFSDGFGLGCTSSGEIYMYDSAFRATSPSGTVTTNTWYHIALVRDTGSALRIYSNGNLVATGTATNNYTRTVMTIGANASSSEPLNGYIDDLRVTKGVARYTANFTPPAVPFLGYGKPLV